MIYFIIFLDIKNIKKQFIIFFPSNLCNDIKVVVIIIYIDYDNVRMSKYFILLKLLFIFCSHHSHCKDIRAYTSKIL